MWGDIHNYLPCPKCGTPRIRQIERHGDIIKPGIFHPFTLGACRFTGYLRCTKKDKTVVWCIENDINDVGTSTQPTNCPLCGKELVCRTEETIRQYTLIRLMCPDNAAIPEHVEELTGCPDCKEFRNNFPYLRDKDW